MVVVGGRAPANRWGSGSLQELDQPPIVESVSKLARTLHTAGDVLAGMDEAFTAARSSHRGPVFVDVPMDEFFNSATGPRPGGPRTTRIEPDTDVIARVADLVRIAERPVLVLGTDVWADGAESAALRLVEATGIPALTNGMGRGVVPGGHPLLVTKARGAALGKADLVVVGQSEGFVTGDPLIKKALEGADCRLHFPGFVEQNLLKSLYTKAIATVFPSHYEGFGLGHLESMTLGCPVLASDIPTTKEVCGEAAITFDPNDPHDLAEKLIAIENDSQLRIQMKSKGLERAKLFPADRPVERAVELLRSLVN